MINQALQELLERYIPYKLQDIWTAIPCVILTVHDNLENQRVDLQPVISRNYESVESEEYPPILSVPLIFPSSKKSSLTFPIEVGDTVLCVFSKVGTDTFKASDDNSITEPLDYRTFDYRDAIAIPGLFTFSQAINNPGKYTLSHSTKDLCLTHNIGTSSEVKLQLGDDGSCNLENSFASFEISANGGIEITSGANSIKMSASGIEVTSPTVLINGINFSLHTHTTTTPGNPTSPPLP